MGPVCPFGLDAVEHRHVQVQRDAVRAKHARLVVDDPFRDGRLGAGAVTCEAGRIRRPG
jgi:hypothetical protein